MELASRNQQIELKSELLALFTVQWTMVLASAKTDI
ncbi:uncharacterized protein G2W53_038953 [Senna tora]|uniref:Uncharacterized protein n=1 Tax=Senna tora TaxID=362788 RepID=A0A834SSM0_9FABA|nr:uncharacterized protein G2W53_038953 [Senna tora]